MAKLTLFSSDRPLERAENLKAVWDAYDGPKEFMQYIPRACAALCERYSAFVVDCTPQRSATKGDVKTVFVSHGLPGDKLYGLDKSEHHRPGCEQVDYAICTTEYTRMRYASELGLPPDRVVATGFPMHDRYHGVRKGDGGTVLSAFRRAYLYAPTWRAEGNPPLPRIVSHRTDYQTLVSEYRIIGAYDSETTNYKIEGKPIAFPILHQLGLFDGTEYKEITSDNIENHVQVELYRHTFELYERLDDLVERESDYVPVIVCHNLAFDMYGLSSWLSRHDVKVLAKSARKPITFTILDENKQPRLVIWDTLIFSQQSLGFPSYRLSDLSQPSIYFSLVVLGLLRYYL